MQGFLQDVKDYVIRFDIYCNLFVPVIPGGPLKSLDGLTRHDDGFVACSAPPPWQCTRIIKNTKILTKKCFIMSCTEYTQIKQLLVFV